MTAGSEHKKTGSLEPEEDLGAASALLGFGQAETATGRPARQTARHRKARPRPPEKTAACHPA